MKKKYGFTLAEVLITLVTLGIVIALTVPSILQKKPNENMAKFKKAYSTAEKVISDLANDEIAYGQVDANDEPIVFRGNNEVTIDGRDYEGNTKFCELFASRVNTIGPINCNNTGTWDNPNFQTSDGISWIIPISTFGANRATGDVRNGALEIQVDVNNGNRSPDRADGNNPDRFRLWVDYDGKITIPDDDEVAIEYLRQTSPSYKFRG